VLVEGFDALAEAVKATKEGQMLATVDQQASEQGYRGVISAIGLLHGDKVADVVEVDAKLITK
jgi:ribose transport system substrate-binding protein